LAEFVEEDLALGSVEEESEFALGPSDFTLMEDR
jgi:hypothetical protein